MEQRHAHIILITYPAQGHINPSLHLAERLVDMGMHVTFTTSLSGRRCMPQKYRDVNPSSTSDKVRKGLHIKLFSDGYDEGIKNTADSTDFYAKLKHNGAKCLEETIASSAQGNPVSCVVYTIFYPWVAEVARGFHLPSMLYWIQPAAVLDIYYYYFNGYERSFQNMDEPSWSIKLPGLPLLKKRDLPSFILPSTEDVYTKALAAVKQHFDEFNSDPGARVLVNTCEDLEHSALKSIEKLNLVAVGPVIQSGNFSDGRNDSVENSGNYIDWLNSKAESSVIYISFGTMLKLPKAEMEEIAKGLLKSGRPFLWVVKRNEDDREEDNLSCTEELKKQGLIVPWCAQIEVLCHKALGCFMTHCGWNSTLESLASGVPVVAYPKWTDQGTIAKMIEDVWKTGVRVSGSEVGNVDGEEIYGCLETVMGGGERAEELRRNAKKWKDLAREAVKEGGSSYNNLKALVQDI
ncbi:hypothetical protein DCAR_0832023 [Daucus carota subsp. sativus]|uniref:Glycosyltransferase n=1 Tax=Daucus carota subsp. sativus TaxID=79200 RepID=A0A175YNM8_DAUCS|nr:PREDICTED: crocetin glucosyltransferase, chloroplastic-like [Daucus carota subsp. sativus]WOH12519.1 hypothetical protein DCAR_0832023 [Daucus carota subsp. sativus]